MRFIFQVLPVALLSGAAAANCRPGETMTVMAVSNLSCTARWDGNCQNDQIWNPEPGWAIREARTVVHSSNNGSRSVSVIAGGSEFVSEQELQAAFDSATRVAAEAPGEGGQQQRYAGALRQKYDEYVSLYRNVRASNNTVQAQVRAFGSGNFSDQRRGWEGISVETTLVCIGAPGQVSEITDHLLREAGVPSKDATANQANSVISCPNPNASVGSYTATGSELFSQQSLQVVAGGTVDLSLCAFDDLDGDAQGYVAAEMSLKLDYLADSNYDLVVQTMGDCDTVLLINNPNGEWVYNDDMPGGISDAELLIPSPNSGIYNVWVGTYDPVDCQVVLHLETFLP